MSEKASHNFSGWVMPHESLTEQGDAGTVVIPVISQAEQIRNSPGWQQDILEQEINWEQYRDEQRMQRFENYDATCGEETGF